MKKVLIWIIGVALLGVIGYMVWDFLYTKQSAYVYTDTAPNHVQLYFFNEKTDPNHTVCDFADPYDRVVDASVIGIPFRTIELLIAGPTAAEVARGAYSPIPPGVRLIHFEITKEETNIVIDYDIRHSSPCTQKMIDTQIRQTLSQFNNLPPININPVKLIGK